MALFSVGGRFGIGPANPQVRNALIPRLKLNPTTPAPQTWVGQAPQTPGSLGTLASGGGFMTGGGGDSPYGPAASAARNAENAAKRSGDQIKQWLSQLAYGQGPFAKLMVDPSKAINAAMPGITEKMTGDFNEAANRLGATGMLGFSQGEMKAGTPYQDLLGQAAKSANLGREEIRSKYQFEADKANQDTMLALLDKFGIGGGVGGSVRAAGGGGGGYQGALQSAAGGPSGGPVNADVARAQKGLSAQTLMANAPGDLPPVMQSGGLGKEIAGGAMSFSDWAKQAFNVDPRDMTPEAVNYARAQYEAQKQADVARYKKGLQTYVAGPPVGAVSSR